MHPALSGRRHAPTRPSSILAVAVALLMLIGVSPAARAATSPSTHARTAASRAAASCGTDDAAKGRPATASSTEGAAFAAADAVDGDTSTRWASAWSDPQWIQVDLGSTQDICQVVLQWEAAAKAYQIQTSADAANWTTIYSTANGQGGTETLNVSGSGRYLRVYGTARTTGYGYSLWELTVHTGAAQQPPADWTPVWQDEFTGPAGTSPSSNDWITDTGTGAPGGPDHWGTGEVETMSNSPANVSADGNGHLNITALRDSAGNWTSGRIETKRSDFAAPVGGMLKVTASIRQPNPDDPTGYWPAFWALGAANRAGQTWPGVGETDVMENVNGHEESSSGLHCGVAPHGPCNEYSGRGSGLRTCTGCLTGYHTYTQIIDRTRSDEQIRWYVDDQLTWSVSESQVGVTTWQQAVDHGFFLILDLAIGGSWPDADCGCTSPTAATSSGGAMSVASVAVYQSTGPAPTPLAAPPPATGSNTVRVTGTQGDWQLTVNGTPYKVKGLTWGPGNAAGDGYLADAASLGANTIRTWGTDASSGQLLGDAAARGLKVINGFWLNQNADYVNDTTYKTNTLNDIKAQVSAYKDNPGTLMWDVGNEVLLTLQNTYSGSTLEAQRHAYAAYVDQVAQAIHAIDPNHPVTSTDAWTGAWPYYKADAPHLDLYAVNAYGAVCSVAQDWTNGGYTKPYIVTESGEPGEWEVPNDANGVPAEPTDREQRDGYTKAWNCINGHQGVSLGGTLFNYGVENDFGGVWYNLLTGGWKRLSYYAVKQAYTGTTSSDTPPVISDLTLSPATNIPAGGRFTVSVAASNPTGDTLRYGLALSGKYVDGSTALRTPKFTQTGAGTFSITAPERLGAWKVYVYIYDTHGNVAIQSQSFRVTAPPVAGTNVALSRPTIASSYQATGNGAPYPPSNATDGNWSTRWASDWSDPQWIQVDLGRTVAIRHVQLGWEAAYGQDYQIQTSDDGTTWRTVHTTTGGDGGIDDFDVTGAGRYVRLYCTKRGAGYGYSLYEFGVYA